MAHSLMDAEDFYTRVVELAKKYLIPEPVDTRRMVGNIEFIYRRYFIEEPEILAIEVLEVSNEWPHHARHRWWELHFMGFSAMRRNNRNTTWRGTSPNPSDLVKLRLRL